MERKTLVYKPGTREELKVIIKEHFKRGKTNLNDIDTSLIVDMSWLFRNTAYIFDISGWNIESVINMSGMFWGCTEFNCDINGWNTKNVEDMSYAFCGCSSFNQDLSRWNMRNLVWKRRYMFYDCPIKEEYKPKYLNLYRNETEDDYDIWN